MVTIVKRELQSYRSDVAGGCGAGSGGASGGGGEPGGSDSVKEGASGGGGELEGSDSVKEGASGRRIIRSGYLAVKTRIHDDGDEILKTDSSRFEEIFEHVEDLHKQVRNPREQVADAEALLNITSSLLSSVKATNKEGITPSEFINSLFREFRRKGGQNGGRDSVVWSDIGVVVSHIFKAVSGCCTMIGPMDVELKKKRAYVRRKHTRLMESSQPMEVDDTSSDKKKDTDKNMLTMFTILKKNRRVRLENLVLNRNSFAQTVENLFALSFLVKDGRAEIGVDEKGYHLVSPRNAPANSSILSGEVAYCHFVFRFDYKDWKLMVCSIAAGDELMPHRQQEFTSFSNSSQPEPMSGASDHSENRGLVLQDQSLVEDSPESIVSDSFDVQSRTGKPLKLA